MKNFTKFLTLVGFIAVAEFLVMVLLPIFGVRPGVWKDILDALLLSVIVTPFIYKFVKADAALSERTRHTALSAEIGKALVKGATLREALQGCAEAIVLNLDAAFARIWTLNEEENVLELQASAGMYTHIDGAHGRMAVGKYKIGIIAQERKPHLTNKVIGDPQVHDQEWAKREGMVAFAGYPLVIGGRLVGVAAMFARRPLSEATLKAIGSVADEITLGIERMRAADARKASEERFRGMVDESIVGAYIIQDGRLRYANRRMAEMYGYTRDELSSMTVADVAHPGDLAMEEELNRGLLSGELDFLHYEVRRIRKDGGVINVEMHRWRTLYEGRQAVIGTALDITQRKEMERERDEFYAMVTHDLKSPLTVIQGYANIIISSKRDKVDGETLEMVGDIFRSSERIKNLVDDFLMQSKLGAGVPLNLQPVDAALMVEEVAETFAGDALNSDLTLGVESEDGLPKIYMDKCMVERALGNLVQNALIYTPSGGSITLKGGHAVEDDANFIVFSVSDTGPGIPVEEQGRIFDKFYRASRTSNVKGTGLGLAIVKSVAEAHGGRVEMHCPEGVGCTFKLFLPVE